MGSAFHDTIFALSTPPGRGGVAMVRVSGQHARASALKLSGKKDLVARQATYAKISDPVSRETLDHAVLTYYRGPASFTGDDVVEYAVHGSPAVVGALLDVLSAEEGHRLAEAGEFTRRAFENGKLDLTEAEAVADLIHAETALQRRQALSQLEGSLSNLYEGWAARLTKALAYLEAAIDFADEDLPADFTKPVLEDVATLQDEISAHLNDNHRGERLRDGIRLAIIGTPNAGKSSLLNRLARREAAIVSPFAGTTRDVIDVHLDIGGYPVILSDTAGLRPEELGETNQDAIESEGIRRALKAAHEADICLLLLDGARPLTEQKATLDLLDGRAVLALTKSDLKSAPESKTYQGLPVTHLSSVSGDGLVELTRILAEKCEALFGLRETPSLTQKRHREALVLTSEHLARALRVAQPDLLAEDVRLALRSLGAITGRVDVEDLLDVIFRDFCIGK
ncbi:MAG: tRNA uridine-5-carboxymethylaminomethyl(34) synthesis GTPase MnmE [Pseudobdellovibrionaceae bacterium]